MSRQNERAIQPCFCKGTIKEPLVAVAGCSDDLAAVSALPDQWVPRHCGPTLTHYLKEQKQNHEKLLQDLMQDAARINQDVDTKIRTISEILLAHIKQNQNDIDCVIETSTPDEGVLTVEVRNEALKEITKLFTSRIQDLQKFKQEALGLERERADGIRSIFKSQFQRLIAVGHKTPKDLLHDFDDRIYETNQQLLSNSRAYIELEAQLRLQLDESIVRARSALNQLCLKQSKVTRGQSALPWTRKSQSFHKRSDSAASNTHNKVDQAGNSGVLVDIEEFKVCVSQLVDAYRNGILKIFSGFSSQLDDLHKDIGFHNLQVGRRDSVEVTLELENMINRALKRISNSNVQVKGSIYKDLEEMARNDVQHMQQSLSTLGKCLRDTYLILFDASHLWDDHILRSALVQKLTVAAVEDMQTNHDIMELANEVNFNITLEQLRCAPDTDKLQQNFDVAMNLLKRISEMNTLHSESEIAKLEEYMNLPLIMANVLLAECDVFLENHPKTILEASGSLTSPVGIGSPMAKSFTLRAPLPRAILQTELQEVALNNWKNGFLDSFEYNLPAVSEELNRQARKWVDERSLQLNMRFSLKLMSHAIRAERVRAAKEARLAELRFHEQRLESHLDAMYDRIDGLPLEASSFLAMDAPELYPFCKWIDSIQTDMDNLLSRDPDPEVKRLKLLSYAPRLVKHREHFEESLDLAMEGYKKGIQHEIQVARISNFRFMSQLKVFIEGGKYAAAEATKACAALVKASDALETCMQRCTDALHTRRSQLLALADQLMLPIQRVVDEVNRDKHVKKKPPANKKK